MIEALSKDVVEGWTFLRENCAAAVTCMRSLPKVLVLSKLQVSFPHMLSTEVMERLQNRCYTSSSIRCNGHWQSLLYEWLRVDAVESDLGQLVDAVGERARQHPADWVRRDNGLLQMGWTLHLFKLSSASVCVRLTADAFGEPVIPALDVLHTDRTFSYERGSLILRSQARVYSGLAAFIKDLLSQRIREVCPIPSDGGQIGLDSVYAIHHAGIVMEGPGGPIQALSALLRRAGQIVSPGPRACQTLIPAIFSHVTAFEEVGLSYTDSVSGAYQEVIGARIANLMRLSLLLKDLENLSELLKAGSTSSTTPASVLDAIEAVEQGVFMIVRATSAELKVNYREAEGWQVLEKAAAEGIDGISPIMRVQFQHERPLCWYLVQLFDEHWPLSGRISDLVGYIRHQSEFFEDFITNNVIALATLTACQIALETIELLQPCTPVVLLKQQEALPKSSIMKYHRSVSALDFPPKLMRQAARLWKDCVQSNFSQQAIPFRKFWSAMFQHTDQVWKEAFVDNACVKRVKQALVLGDIGDTLVETDDVAILDLDATNGVEHEHLPASRHGDGTRVLFIALPDDSEKTDSSEAPTLEPKTSYQGTQTSLPNSPTRSLSTHTRSRQLSRSRGLTVQPTAKTQREARERCSTPRSPLIPFESTIPHQSALGDGSFVGDTHRRPLLPEQSVTEAKDDSRTPVNLAAQPVSRPREKLVFTDAEFYDRWREVFPLRGERHLQRRNLTFAQFREVMRASPLNFQEDYIGMPEAKFTRKGGGDGGGKVFTCHQPHSAKPVLTQGILTHMRKRFNRNFGWEAEDFILEEE